MLVRIVRMYFVPENVPVFLEIFNKNKEAIASFPGCLSVELFRDSEDENCYSTVSRWHDASDLEGYRTSSLFIGIWKSVRPFFSKKAEAVSLIG